MERSSSPGAPLSLGQKPLKSMNRCHQVFAVSIALLSAFSSAAFAQHNRSILHTFPRFGAREVSVRTDIGLRADQPYDSRALQGSSFVAVGSFSGRHELRPILSHDRHTLVL